MPAHHNNYALAYTIHPNHNVEYIEMESTNEWDFKFWPCDHGMDFNIQCDMVENAGGKFELLYFKLDFRRFLSCSRKLLYHFVVLTVCISVSVPVCLCVCACMWQSTQFSFWVLEVLVKIYKLAI